MDAFTDFIQVLKALKDTTLSAKWYLRQSTINNKDFYWIDDGSGKAIPAESTSLELEPLVFLNNALPEIVEILEAVNTCTQDEYLMGDFDKKLNQIAAKIKAI